MGWNDRVDFSVLKGKTLDAIDGAEIGSDLIRFLLDDGSVYVMYHRQDCCESVSVEDVIGDVADLIGLEILEAEEVSGETPTDHQWEYEPDSYTWTFYKIGTQRGSVTIRWLGQSNGYYSERVDFERAR